MTSFLAHESLFLTLGFIKSTIRIQVIEYFFFLVCLLSSTLVHKMSEDVKDIQFTSQPITY